MHLNITPSPPIFHIFSVPKKNNGFIEKMPEMPPKMMTPKKLCGFFRPIPIPTAPAGLPHQCVQTKPGTKGVTPRAQLPLENVDFFFIWKIFQHFQGWNFSTKKKNKKIHGETKSCQRLFWLQNFWELEGILILGNEILSGELWSLCPF